MSRVFSFSASDPKNIPCCRVLFLGRCLSWFCNLPRNGFFGSCIFCGFSLSSEIGPIRVVSYTNHTFFLVVLSVWIKFSSLHSVSLDFINICLSAICGLICLQLHAISKVLNFKSGESYKRSAKPLS